MDPIKKIKEHIRQKGERKEVSINQLNMMINNLIFSKLVATNKNEDISVSDFVDNIGVLLSEIKGDVVFITGNDGDLQYWHICLDCGTLICDEHDEDYQYNRPTLLCPICNKAKDSYPFKYIKYKTDQWYARADWFSGRTKAKLLTKEDLNYVCDNLLNKKSNKILNWWNKIKYKHDYYKQIKSEFTEEDFIYSNNLKNVELKYQNKGK